MKGFDDHLDNYGDPGPQAYAENEEGISIAPTGPNGYPLPQEEAIKHINACLPYVAFYDGADGEVLALTDGGNYLISISPDGSTSSAYLINQPPEDVVNPYVVDELSDIKGFATGWEC